MDSKKLTALCFEARLLTRDIETKLAINILSEISTGMLVSLSQAIYCDDAKERIMRLDEVLINFGKLEEQIHRLETLRERLNLEEAEHDNQ